MSPGELAARVEAALGMRVIRMKRTAGGDINEAYALELAGGGAAFLKTNPHAHPDMFPAEARGLQWLGSSGHLRIPKVLAVARGDESGPGFLVLEHVASGLRGGDYDEQLGRGLAALHRSGARNFGLDHDNFIGSLPQSNRPTATWAEFYRERRLGASLALALALAGGRSSIALRHALERLMPRLEQLVGPPEPPARLHGDLWAGNAIVDDRGAPCLIDPAVYGGHREIDLAMMRLFGGFGDRTFRAYDEAYPLAPGHAERVALYQLYPLLVHVNLFGGSYVGQALRAAERYL